MTSVALVGPDGSGKSTVARRVLAAFPSAVYVYAGTNPDEPQRWLLTTRLLVRFRGGTSHGQPARVRAPSRRAAAVSWLRTLVWLSEELFRGRQIRRLERTASVVVRDRDFLADRLAGPGTPATHDRFHVWVLRHWYPAPDATIVLDVPASVAFERKGELTVAEIESRRRKYLDLGGVLPQVSAVDATRDPAEVTADVIDLIADLLNATS